MHKYGELLRAILEKRGIRNEVDAEIFLNPDYERDLFSPYDMRDMERACVKLFEVIEAKEKTIIYADYDCDGIPGAVILSDLFKKTRRRRFFNSLKPREFKTFFLSIARYFYFITSRPPIYGRKASGMTMLPSACW